MNAMAIKYFFVNACKVSTIENVIKIQTIKMVCNVLVCCGAGNNQSELLLVRNFRELNARTADGALDVIFSVWGVVCTFKRHMSRLC